MTWGHGSLRCVQWIPAAAASLVQCRVIAVRSRAACADPLTVNREERVLRGHPADADITAATATRDDDAEARL